MTRTIVSSSSTGKSRARRCPMGKPSTSRSQPTGCSILKNDCSFLAPPSEGLFLFQDCEIIGQVTLDIILRPLTEKAAVGCRRRTLDDLSQNGFHAPCRIPNRGTIGYRSVNVQGGRPARQGSKPRSICEPNRASTARTGDCRRRDASPNVALDHPA